MPRVKPHEDPECHCEACLVWLGATHTCELTWPGNPPNVCLAPVHAPCVETWKRTTADPCVHGTRWCCGQHGVPCSQKHPMPCGPPHHPRGFSYLCDPLEAP